MVAAVLTGCWAIGVALAGQAYGWLVDQFMVMSGVAPWPLQWPLVSVVTVLLVGVPALLLARLPRSAALRATGRAWLAAALALGLLGMFRAIPVGEHERYLLVTTFGALLLAGVLRWRGTLRAEAVASSAPAEGSSAASPGSAGVPAAVVGVAMLLPWLWVGALGGAAETLCAALAAAAVGLLAGQVLDRSFWTSFRAGADRPYAQVLVAGLVAGVALLMLGSATGHSGTQLALLFTLPAVAFALAAVQQTVLRAGQPPRSAPVVWLVGLTLFGPLAFTDPEEISVVLLTDRDVPYWVLIGTLAGAGVGLLISVCFAVGAISGRGRLPRRWDAVAAVVVVLLAATLVYTGPGRPGLYGERLFVVLAEQADLSDITGEPGQQGRDARAREVYRRLVETADRTQEPLRRELDRLRLDYTPYYLVNAIEVSGGPALGAWLAGRPEVDRVLVSQRLRPVPEQPPVSTGDEEPDWEEPAWNIQMLRADRVWDELGTRGTGIVVGTSDSGVDGDHPVLASRFRGGDDSWYDPWNGTTTPVDRNGHGTHTLGTAVGLDGLGVAPGAQWVGCVNLDRNLGNPAYYLDCLQFMLAPFPAGGDPFTDGRPERAPHVLTNSWGCPPMEGCDPASLQPAATALATAGIFVVAAAGNTGPRCGSIEDPPAPYADVLTVGAVDRYTLATDFSSRGPTADGTAKPDLVAPGAEILSAMPNGTYGSLGGTSMAAPHVAGVVALMWSARPELIGDVPTTTRILKETTQAALPGPENCGDPRNVIGTGMVDAFAAVKAAQAAD